MSKVTKPKIYLDREQTKNLFDWEFSIDGNEIEIIYEADGKNVFYEDPQIYTDKDTYWNCYMVSIEYIGEANKYKAIYRKY